MSSRLILSKNREGDWLVGGNTETLKSLSEIRTFEEFERKIKDVAIEYRGVGKKPETRQRALSLGDAIIISLLRPGTKDLNFQDVQPILRNRRKLYRILTNIATFESDSEIVEKLLKAHGP